MAVLISVNTLSQLVLNNIKDYKPHSNRRLSDFKLSSNFFEQCEVYLKNSPPPCGRASRFELPFECFVKYNYYKEPRGEEFNEKLTRVPASPEEVEGWQHAIRSLQRYCFNLLLAPKRKDFHSIKLSTAYYQYNIDSKFKGGEKILEALGYKMTMDTGKPDYRVLVMQYKSDPSELTAKKKIAKLVVDLILFDLELATLLQCIELHNKRWPNDHCNIMNALEARKKTQGGVDEAMKSLRKIVQDESKAALGKVSSENNRLQLSQSKEPPYQQTGSSSGVFTESGDYNTPLGSFTTSKNVNATQTAGHKDGSFPRIDPAKDLPPPDIDDPSDNFTSVMPHINSSSDWDDDGLIRDSTHLGYRNPPETKHNALAGRGPTAYPQAIPGVYGPPYPPQTIPSSAKNPLSTAASSCDKTRPGHPSGVSQYGQATPYQTQDDFSRDFTRRDYDKSISHGSGDGIHSLPSSSMRPTAASRNLPIDNQLTPAAGGAFVRQKSMPSSGSDETNITYTTSPAIAPVNTVAAMTTTATNSSTILATYANMPGNPAVSTAVVNKSTSTTTASTSTPMLYGNVPLQEPVSAVASEFTTTSTAPKHGKLDLANLRKKTKEVTANIPVQDLQVTDNPPPQLEKRDLTTLKDHLHKKRDTRTTVEGINVKTATPSDNYVNFDDFSQQRPQVAKPTSTVPINKRPAPTPRSSKDSSSNPALIQIDDLHLSGKVIEQWRCAVCEMVNKAQYANCRKCLTPAGLHATAYAYCGFCNLIVYVPEEKMSSASICPLCQDTLNKCSVI